VHHIGVMLTSKDVTGATHIGCQLINLIEAAVDDCTAKTLVPQIADYKIIRFSFREFVKFQVHAAHPEPVTLEPFDQMAADESTSPTDQRTLRHKILSFRPEAPLDSSNDAGEADVTRWAISSRVCVPNPEGLVDPFARYPAGRPAWR
jgi:hypothetical protein